MSEQRRAIRTDKGIIFPDQLCPETRRSLGISPPEKVDNHKPQQRQALPSYLLGLAEVVDMTSVNAMEESE